jgi:alcohol dehydrogenase class IV
MNQKIFSGYGACKELQGILKEFSPKKVFFVTGRESYSSSGAEKLLGEIIKGFDHVRFYDFEINPKLKDIERGIDLFNRERCDFIIGVGGGSVIDVAKAISLLVTQQGKLEAFIEGSASMEQRKIPSVVIPTTAGTGSESTHFSVVYLGKVKHSLAHTSMLPDFAILDPTFTENLPAYITACTGMDALSQSIESFWSTNSTEESRVYSVQAIKLALPNLVKGVNDPDKKSRENLLIASNLAGRAINIAKTTAAHALSYPLTAYFNIPHGHAVALSLPYFIEFNNDISPENLQDSRGVKFVRKRLDELVGILGVKTSDHAKEKILNLMKEINLETRLSRLGVDKNSAEIVAKNGLNPQRVKNNPRLVFEADLRTLIGRIS